MKSLLHLSLAFTLIGAAPAAVTLTFNSTTDGFSVVSGGVNAVA